MVFALKGRKLDADIDPIGGVGVVLSVNVYELGLLCIWIASTNTIPKSHNLLYKNVIIQVFKSR